MKAFLVAVIVILYSYYFFFREEERAEPEVLEYVEFFEESYD